jgi:aspartate-semialdehyde dehydrogenase
MGHRLGVVGATGAVGREFADLLSQRRFPVASLRLLASPRSAGATISFQGEPLKVEALSRDRLQGLDYVFFSAGATVSREFAPAARDHGAVVIDNSSAFRMEPQVPLVVPELNPAALERHQGIIAVPNCSTILLVMVLGPIHRRAGVRRAIVTTYQAASGAGAKAVAELEAQMKNPGTPPSVFPHPIAGNLFPQVGEFESQTGVTGEERKIQLETRKILDEPTLAISATCVRVPVARAHSESVILELERALSAAEARELLARSPGVRVVDEPAQRRYPTPLQAAGGDDVLVGRLRAETLFEHGLALFLAGDQLRKGAALNGIQIAECLARVRSP